MNADLSKIDPKAEPHRFATACVLSPHDANMATSAAAVKALRDEIKRLTGVQTEWAASRRVRCKEAIENIEQLRKLKA